MPDKTSTDRIIAMVVDSSKETREGQKEIRNDISGINQRVSGIELANEKDHALIRQEAAVSKTKLGLICAAASMAAGTTASSFVRWFSKGL